MTDHSELVKRIAELEADNESFLEQLALRSESVMHKDMQEIMRINNQLNARIAELEALNNAAYQDGYCKGRDAGDDKIAELMARIAELEAQENEICRALPTNRFLDPPDGGDVSLPEQISRMWSENQKQQIRIAELGAENVKLREAFKLFPIEQDDEDPSREYIPLPGGWEVQTKGRGSSYRLCDTKTGERHIILCADADLVHDFITRMAKEIHANARAALGE